MHILFLKMMNFLMNMLIQIDLKTVSNFSGSAGFAIITK